MAAIPGSVTLTGFIAPTDTADTYATHNEIYGLGGYRTVSNISERNDIPDLRRKEGMLVNVLSENTVYMLKGGISNTYWVSFSGTPSATDGDKHYQHNQPSMNILWTIAHNLQKYPSITIMDSSGNTIYGDITYTDINNCIISFSKPIAGTAYFN